MSFLRRWLAEQLYPEAFLNERRWFYARDRIKELRDWCGYDFPVLDHAGQWLTKSVYVHFTPLAEYDAFIAKKDFDRVMVGDIAKFREDMRRLYKVKEDAKA